MIGAVVFMYIYIYIYIVLIGSIILGTAQNITKTQYTSVKFNFWVTHNP